MEFFLFCNFRSALCSLSVVGRTTMITPTPRAISPQDIVRIYVPPAPPEEQKSAQVTPKSNKSPSTKDSKPNSITEANNIQKHPNNRISSSSNNASLNGSPKKAPSPPQLPTPTASTVTTVWSSKPSLTAFENESNKNSIISGETTPVRGGFDQSDEDLTRSFIDASLSTNNSLGYIGLGGGASSSSRRGSLSRKSPAAMFESNMLMECSHMIKRRLSSQSNSSINFEVRDKTSNAASNSSLSLRLNSTSNGDTHKRMTSFEQVILIFIVIEPQLVYIIQTKLLILRPKNYYVYFSCFQAQNRHSRQ